MISPIFGIEPLVPSNVLDSSLLNVLGLPNFGPSNVHNDESASYRV
eukprot:SAG31_NODE_1586_length_7821_cov_3.086765_8_plen_46_part_00